MPGAECRGPTAIRAAARCPCPRVGVARARAGQVGWFLSALSDTRLPSAGLSKREVGIIGLQLC